MRSPFDQLRSAFFLINTDERSYAVRNMSHLVRGRFDWTSRIGQSRIEKILFELKNEWVRPIVDWVCPRSWTPAKCFSDAKNKSALMKKRFCLHLGQIQSTTGSEKEPLKISKAVIATTIGEL